tara:strand:- start:52 stop:366 length:315 start_codon:yes stop_codon:yes gene_type:complete
MNHIKIEPFGSTETTENIRFRLEMALEIDWEDMKRLITRNSLRLRLELALCGEVDIGLKIDSEDVKELMDLIDADASKREVLSLRFVPPGISTRFIPSDKENTT